MHFERKTTALVAIIDADKDLTGLCESSEIFVYMHLI